MHTFPDAVASGPPQTAPTAPPFSPSYRYGHFTPEGNAFIITDPRTPRAFDNFLWNDSVLSCVHQTGVGTCDFQIGSTEAIQAFTGVGRVCDVEAYGRDHLMSRLVYVRDNESGAFWNVGWEPVCRAYEYYACEHGLGYTRIASQTSGIETSLLLLVPPGEAPVELWKLSFANRSNQPRDLSVFVYNQYAMSYMWGFESYGDMLYRGAWFEPELNAGIVQKHPYLAPHQHLTAFLAADRKVDGYDGSRRHFVGEYATLAEPEAVTRGSCSNSPGSCEATIIALQFNVSLTPSEEQTIHLVNGLASGLDQVAELSHQHLGTIDQSLDDIQQAKQELVQTNAVTTPDPHFNSIVNVWLKQQSLFGSKWCRWGYMGYRDIVQHGLGVCSFAPERTRSILLEAMAHMNSNGVALRGWNPIDTKAYSDSTLWLVFTLAAYLKQTGDTDLLHAEIPYYDKGQATALEHLEVALEFLENNKGSHGLCLIKFGDWNDSLTNIGREGRGESIWLSMAYTYAQKEMAALYDYIGKPEKAEAARQRAAAMANAIQASAWDGSWFVRCFTDRGEAVGSHLNQEGSIYLNAQSWAIIAGVATDEQQAAMLTSCHQHLKTEIGYRLLAPPYLERDDYLGRITYLEPGICENGTIYSHGNAFLFLAQLMAGLGDDAYETLCLLTPGYVSGPACPKQECPPYIFANGHYAPEHRNNALQVEFTWVTGSIAWWYNSAIDYMLGVRSDYEGLVIRPCLPSEWSQASVQKSYRGKEFDVQITRTGMSTVWLNGKEMEDGFLPLKDCQASNEVRVTV